MIPSIAAVVAPEPSPPSPPPVRLAYLDGVRGLAVAVVVLHHLHLRLADPAASGGAWHGPPPMPLVGEAAVDAFIVLSGYSLMIPVARSADGRLRGGIGRYLRRRVRRILPPYYAALMASLLPLLPGAIGWPRLPWRTAAAGPVDLTAGAVVSHLLLVHNLNPAWAYKISGPLWSLATEWQIYFVFPFLLLPLWRRAGAGVTAAVALTVGVAVGLAWPTWPGRGRGMSACSPPGWPGRRSTSAPADGRGCRG